MPNLHAVFERMIDGRKAVEELKKIGYRAHLDMVSNYINEYSQEINFAGSRRAPSLSALILKSDGHITNIDKGPLVATNPLVSGLSAYGEMENTSTRLIVRVEDDNVDEVKNMIIKLGGNI